MISVTRPTLIAVLVLLVSLNAFAQSVPTQLFGCLDSNGNLYGLTPIGKLGEGCSTGDLPVSIGSAGAVRASNGLVGTVTDGVIDIGVAEGLAIPPSCPPGQIPISDGQGAWICTLPNFNKNPNPGAKVWVVPKWGHNGRLADTVAIVNPGLQPARTICYTMTILGGYVRSLTEEHVISSGGKGRCDAYAERGTPRTAGDYRITWLVIVSDVPILPTAMMNDRRLGSLSSGQSTGQLEAYPIDCRYPEGYELVCDLAIE